MNRVDTRLEALGIVLPEPVAPVANYLPSVLSNGLLHISGQISTDASGGIKGVVGEDVDLERAQAAARLCGVNLLAQIRAACGGDFERVRQHRQARRLRAGGPATSSTFPKVINGCSDLMVEVFGDAGRHARAAVGVYRLPLNFAVEVDAVVALA